MKKKKVLIIAANGMGNSGVPNVFMQIVRHLNFEYTFDIVVTREDYYFKDEFLKYGGKIFLIKENTEKSFVKKMFWKVFRKNGEISKKLRKIMINNTYDVVHSFKELESGVFLKEAKKLGIKTRIIHNNRFIEKSKSPFVNLRIKNKIKNSLKYGNVFVSVSKQAGNSFFGNTNFKVIHNSIDESKYGYSEKKSKDFKIVQIGTILPYKNQGFTLSVLRVLKNDYRNLMCYFIGKKYDKNYYKELVNLINCYDLVDNVKILDENSNQKEVLSDASVSLVPSIKEGLSLVSIEAQACGIRVFASTGVPRDVDLGNITFLELKPEIWAKEIAKFVDCGQYRKKVDIKDFSVESFVNSIRMLYS